MTNLTPELIAKARAAKSVEELMALAKENNVELTQEQASIYFEQMQSNGAVNDEELDLVTGGCGGSSPTALPKAGTWVEVLNGNACPKCGITVGKLKLYSPMAPVVVGVYCYKCDQWIVKQIGNSAEVRQI